MHKLLFVMFTAMIIFIIWKIFFAKSSSKQTKLGILSDTKSNTHAILKEFDENTLLADAKIAYKALVKAMEDKDLAEMRRLTTDAYYAEAQNLMRSAENSSHTEVLEVEAELTDIRELGDEFEAEIFFECLIRNSNTAEAGRIKEIWRFTKFKNSTDARWLVDDIGIIVGEL